MKNKEAYIEVAIALPVDKTFTYVLPEHLRELAAIGKRALVPFGRRKVSGFILKVTPTAAIDDPKPILDIIDHQQLFPPGMVRLFEWMADYYFFPLGLVIKNALPGGLNTRERAALSITPDGREALSNEILTPLERLVLSRLSTAPASTGELAKSIPKGSPQTVLSHLLKRKWITSVRTLKKDRVRAKTERIASLVEANLPDKKLSPARQKIIARLREDAFLPIRELKKDHPNAPDLIRKMAAAGYVSIGEKRVYRDPFGEPIQSKAPPTLTGEQATAVDTIGKAVGNGFTTFLLAGVTGSGKTEVYLRLAQSTLSKGQARQVALLCALCHKPELLLLDEPAGGLDALARREFLEGAIQALSDTGTTIVFSSHYLSDVERLAGRVVMLHDAKVLIDNTIDELHESFSIALVPHRPQGTSGALLALPECLGVRVRTDAVHAVFRLDPEDSCALIASRLGVTDALCRTAGLEEMFIEVAGGER